MGQDMRETIIKELVEAVREIAGEGHEVQHRDIRKNNGVMHPAVIIGTPDGTAEPTVYIDRYIDEIERGITTAAEAAEKVFSLYSENKDPEWAVDGWALTDRKFILSHVGYRVVNRMRNQEVAATSPHRDILDLTVLYRVLIRINEDEAASYIIDNKMLERTGISLDELDKAAERNAGDEGFRAETLIEALGIPDEMAGLFARGPELFVITNESRINGASAILHKKTLREFADRINGDYYILPSSIHEVLAVPASYSDNVEELEAIVREVNGRELDDEEVLSSRVYRYSRSDGELSYA